MMLLVEEDHGTATGCMPQPVYQHLSNGIWLPGKIGDDYEALLFLGETGDVSILSAATSQNAANRSQVMLSL